MLIGAVLFLPRQEKYPRFWPRFLLGSVLAYVVCAANDAVLDLLELSGSDVAAVWRYFLAFAMMVLFIQYGLYEKYALMREADIMKGMPYAERRQHKLSEDTIALINMKRHDLKHQVSALCRQGQVDPALAEEIGQTVAVYDSEVQTGNGALDVVLTEKVSAVSGSISPFPVCWTAAYLTL